MQNPQFDTRSILATFDDGSPVTIIVKTRLDWSPAFGGEWIEGGKIASTSDGHAVMPHSKGQWKVYAGAETSGKFSVATEV
ncbi:MAG: hypothetical protein ACKO0Z_27785 [Betaproteobacteria bacterium]